MMKRLWKRWLARSIAALMFGGCLGACPAFGASQLEDWMRLKAMKPKGYVAGQIKEPLRIDGKLDDSGWASAPWTEDFTDIEGDAKLRPHFRTRAKIVWDKDYLYIGAELQEPHVWGTLTEHDSVIFRDNDFEVFIEPDGDNHNYYEFELNALNTTWDLLLEKAYKDGGPARNEFELTGTKSAVFVDGTLNDPRDEDRGWSLEIAFPWAALKQKTDAACPPADMDLWRVSFSRVEWLIQVVQGKYVKPPGQKEANWVWSPQGIIDMHRPERWGMVRFSKQRPGQGVFKGDPAFEVKDVLHEIYYRERHFQSSEGRYTDSLQELGWVPAASGPFSSKPVISLKDGGFEVRALHESSNNRVDTWRIFRDARIAKGSK